MLSSGLLPTVQRILLPSSLRKDQRYLPIILHGITPQKTSVCNLFNDIFNSQARKTVSDNGCMINLKGHNHGTMPVS
jgi:hypothetical protein